MCFFLTHAWLSMDSAEPQLAPRSTLYLHNIIESASAKRTMTLQYEKIICDK
jgi:hypothetical protein